MELLGRPPAEATPIAIALFQQATRHRQLPSVDGRPVAGGFDERKRFDLRVTGTGAVPPLQLSLHVRRADAPPWA